MNQSPKRVDCSGVKFASESFTFDDFTAIFAQASESHSTDERANS